jgi:thiol-disulfide isomerase/thioredoxin
MQRVFAGRAEPVPLRAFVVVPACLALCACAPREPTASIDPPAAAVVGEPLSLTVADLRSSGILELGALRGRVALVDFWASWCEPCRGSLPFYERLHQDLQGDGLSVVGISIDEERALAERFLDDVPVSFALGWDARHEVAERLGLSTVPVAYLIDREGTLRHVHPGFVAGDEQILEALVRELLARPLNAGADAR